MLGFEAKPFDLLDFIRGLSRTKFCTKRSKFFSNVGKFLVYLLEGNARKISQTPRFGALLSDPPAHIKCKYSKTWEVSRTSQKYSVFAVAKRSSICKGGYHELCSSHLTLIVLKDMVHFVDQKQ